MILKISRSAFLHWLRNVPSGLRSRSSILSLLTKDTWTDISKITEMVEITHTTVIYHLRNMQRESIVEQEPDGSRWKLSENHQLELAEFLSKGRRRTTKKTRK